MGLNQYMADKKKAKVAAGIDPSIFVNQLTQSTFKGQAEDIKPKISWWKKVISVLTTGETGNAAYQMLEGKNPIEEYGKDIIKGITGQGYDKKTYADVLEKIGFGTKKISDIFPDLYSDDGKGVKLRKGGFLDWSGNGTVGLALDIVLDPVTYLGGLGLFQRMGIKGKGLTTAGRSIFNGTNTRVAKIYNELGTTDESFQMVQEITERMTKKFTESPDKYYKGITMFGKNVIPRKVALAPGRLFDSTMQHIPVLGKVYTGAKAGVQDMFVYGADVVRKGKGVSQVGGESAEDYIKLKQQMYKRSREISDNIFNDVTKAMKEFEKGVTKDKRGAILDYVRNKVETGFADFGIEGVDKNLADNLVTIAQRHAKKFYRTEAEAYTGLTKDMYSEVSNYLGHIITDEGRQALKGKAANKFLSKGYSEFSTSPEKARSWFKFVDTKSGDELLGSAESFGLKPYNRGTEVRFLTDKATSVVKKRQNEIKRIMREINNLTKEQIHEALRETGEKLPTKVAKLKVIPAGKKTLTQIGETPNGLKLLRESVSKKTKYTLNTAELKNNETLQFVEQMINLPKKAVEKLAKKIQTRTGWVDDTMQEITSITDDLATQINELPTIKRWFTDSTGKVFRVERHASIDEINTKLAGIMEEAGYKNKPFFMTDPFEIIYNRGTKGAKNIAAAEYYKDVSSKLGIKGTPTEVFRRNELTRKTTKEIVFQDIIDAKTGIRYVDPKIAMLPEGTMLPDFMVEDLKKVKSLIDDEEIGNKILQLYDKFLLEWKGSVYGWYPASHGRNGIGGIFNNFLAGLWPGDKRYFMVRKVINGSDETIKAKNGAVLSFKQMKKGIATRGVLGQTGMLDVNDLKNAFHPSIGRRVHDVPMKAMEFVENNLRIPLFIKTWQDTGSLDEAAKMVFKYHFDYAPEALTNFERTVMKRIIPFYRWCLSDDSEYLTNRGWKYFNELKDNEIVLTWNPETKELEWQQIKEKAQFDFEGKIMAFKNSDHHWQFTDDHRWYIKDKYSGKYKVKRGYELADSDRIPLTGNYTGTKSILSPQLAAILGWIVTDGYHRKKGNHHEMLIYQSPNKFADKIFKLLEIDKKEYTRKPHPISGVLAISVPKRFVQEIIKIYKSKDDLEFIVGNLSREAAESMWEAMFEAEGSVVRNDEKHFAQDTIKNKKVADAFQILTLLIGKTTTIRDSGCYIKKGDHVTIKTQYLIREYYSGKVGCVVTPNQTFIARRNGSPFITGNTRGNIPLMIEEFIAQPAKMTGLFKSLRDMQDENGDIQMDLLPSYIEKEFAVTRGGQTVTGTGLPPLEMLKYMREPVRQFESGMTPFLKIPIEIATNYSLFKDMAVSEDTSGTFAENYTQVLKDWLQYKEKKVEKKDGTSYVIKTVDPMRKYWLYALPTARLASLASTVMGEKEQNKLLNAISGLRTFEFDMQQLRDSQQKIYEEKLIEILTNAGLFGQIEYPFADTKEAAGIKSTPAKSKSKNPFLNR